MRFSIDLYAIIVSTTLVLGCSTKHETEIQTYGIITESNKHKIELINPDNYDSYNDLYNKIEQIVCNDRIPTISVKSKYSEKWMGLATLIPR